MIPINDDPCFLQDQKQALFNKVFLVLFETLVEGDDISALAGVAQLVEFFHFEFLEKLLGRELSLEEFNADKEL